MGVWGVWALLLLPLQAAAQAQVCSVNKTVFEVTENTEPSGPLVDIYVPEGQRVTLGSSSTPFAFKIQGTQLFLNVTPDYEETPVLLAYLECQRGDVVVTQLRVLVTVLDVNDNPPVFPFEVKVEKVPEDTKVNTTVIPETQLEAQDLDKDDTLFYTLQEVTPGASSFFSLVGVNRPALQLDKPLAFDRLPNMTFYLLVRDTQEEDAVPSHTAQATLVLEVQPADLRPPWFLPCVYSDTYVCVQAQYQGAIPTGYKLPDPLILRPGPIYAVDGDRGIDQRIIYSLLTGNEDGTFAIDADTGNLTMTRSVPSPKTFFLIVKGDQADHARYSVTQVTVEARNATESLPRFPASLYRGTVALGSATGTVVQDAAEPSLPLRVWAQDPDFPDLNSAITYRITNNSDFRMGGEFVLTVASLTQLGVFYAEVEATNTVTSGTATTVVEIHVSEQEPPATEPPGTPTSPVSGGTTRSLSTTSEAPRPPGPSQSLSTTSSGGSAGPNPSSGATLRPPASSTPGGPPSAGTSTTSSSASPSRGSAQTPKPETSQPTQLSSNSSTSATGRPGNGVNTTRNDEPGVGRADRRFSAVDMAALGGVLGALLLLALIALVTLVHKHYGSRLKCCSGKALEPPPGGFDNKAFLVDPEANWAPGAGPSPGGTAPAAQSPGPPLPAPPASPSPATADLVPEAPAAAGDGDGPAGVRSILTKERRPEGGYKAVWFGEDIGAEADVVVLDTPASDADGAGAEGSAGSADEDEDEDAAAGLGGGPDAADAD
ncbi:cadherin-related family member 5 isoform X2 [Rousettus aegyptiacus]|uniref:Cadherin-related family member 5 n=1 Tax=Rousettus aegyptiacus TaxID=9407 RepID=A0A7J8GXS5_ROUAE|nr:cadherin-related family member 5 isoform X2 [Rousettus aegyptiacus]KAF6464455.1 cadherin related family member 5 [Rousettus aegyptiacus]